MSNDKSPGLDGFTTNFYKFFWIDIKEMVYDSFQFALKQGKLGDSQRRGVISLIPKKEKDLRYIKSWRPVTLLPTDYKILAKTLAKRLQTVVSSLVSSDQVGYIKGRYLSQNVRLIEDIIAYTSKSSLSGLLVLIDFQKAFDTVEWDFLFNTLKSYNFGPIFQSWIKLLYTEVSSCTINNGYLSKNFELTRGIRQGCPISAFLFILIAEILSLKLKSTENARGITIGKFEYKVIQLADDTTIFMNDLESLKVAIKIFLEFEKIAGLKINLEKCEVIELGPMKLDLSSFGKELSNLKVNRSSFRTLGVWFSKNCDESVRLNYEERFQKIETLIQIWGQRNLSWKGRIMIIKTLILSQVTHLFSMIFTPMQFLERLDTLIFKFLWQNKPPRIKRETIIASIKDGGLRMPDIHAFHIAQKVMCMKNLILEDGKGLSLFLETSGIRKSMLNHKLNEQYFSQFCLYPFHKQILNCWFGMKSTHPVSRNEILNEYIFENVLVTINNKPLHPKDFGLGLSMIDLRVADIISNDNRFYTPLEFVQKLKCNINFLYYFSIIGAIPRNWKSEVGGEKCNFVQIPDFSILINKKTVATKKLTSKKLYWEMLNSKTKPPTAIDKWLDLFPFLEHFNWEKIYTNVYKISDEPYLQTFQYKIINRTVNCRHNLHRWKLLASGKCYYCEETDTIEHHFFYCLSSSHFWIEVSNLLFHALNCVFKLSVCEVLFGIIECTYADNETVASLNLLILLGKWYINQCKNGEREMQVASFVNLLKEKLKILKMNSLSEIGLDNYYRMYGKLDALLL